MKSKLILLTSGLLVALLSVASAEEPGKKKGKGKDREDRRAKMLEQFDTDGDGKLNEEERKAAKEAREAERIKRFKAADTDKNGTVSQEEFKAIPRIVKLAERRADAPDKIFTRMDKNKNGVLEEAEFDTRSRDSRRKGKGKKGGKEKRS